MAVGLCCEEMVLPSVLIYSYWLVAWTALSFFHVVPVPAPTLSLGVACAFNVLAAFLLPWVGVYVGSGTAAYSTRVMVVTLETAVFVAALLNPIVPINDDFLFIRPAVMTARSTANRLDYAERGLQDAIRRLK